jgi:hypothetical protein
MCRPALRFPIPHYHLERAVLDIQNLYVRLRLMQSQLGQVPG